MMEVDARLCKNHLVCRSFQQSYRAGAPACVGCKGDIAGLRVISTVVDQHLDPVIATVLTTDQNETMGRFVEAALAIRQEFASSHGMDVEPGEVGMLIGLRLMQRVETLQTEARVRARRRR